MLALVGVSAGCAHLPSGPFPPPAADVTSPLASEIAKLDPKDAPYPSFLSVPNRPQDVRPATAWTRNIYNTIRLRRQLRALAALNPQGLYGAEAFAKQARLEAATPLTPAEAAALTDNTTKFAKGTARSS